MVQVSTINIVIGGGQKRGRRIPDRKHQDDIEHFSRCTVSSWLVIQLPFDTHIGVQTGTIFPARLVVQCSRVVAPLECRYVPGQCTGIMKAALQRDSYCSALHRRCTKPAHKALGTTTLKRLRYRTCSYTTRLSQ